MVFAFAGDSTMTRRLCFVLVGHVAVTIAGGPRGHHSERDTAARCGRPWPTTSIAAATWPAALRPLSASLRRARRTFPEGGCVLAVQPSLELRPVAARDAAVAEDATCASWRSRSSTGSRSSKIIDGAGAFPVRRGQHDTVAMETAIRLAREGNIVAMFPEGTRRAERAPEEARGASAHRRRAHRARGRRAARSRRGAREPTGCAGSRKLRVAYGAPVDIDDLRGLEIAEAAQEATDAADGAHHRARGVALSVLLAVDGDSLAHRAYHGGPKNIRLQRDLGLRELARAALARREARRDGRRLGHAHRADVPARGVHRVPVGTRVRRLDPRAARPAAAARQRRGLRRGKGDGYEADDFLAAAAHTWPGEVRVVTSDRDAYPARQRPGDDPPADEGRHRLDAHRRRRRARALRRRPGAGRRPDRAARRSVGQAAGRAGHRAEEGRRPPAAVRHARRGARRRALRLGGGDLRSTGESHDGRRRRRCRAPPTHERTGGRARAARELGLGGSRTARAGER